MFVFHQQPSSVLILLLLITTTTIKEAYSKLPNTITYFPTNSIHHSTSNAQQLKPSSASAAAAYNYKTKYFPQTLDHFNFLPQSSTIFYQTYLINDHFWRHGAPIFVYTGNEGDIDWFASNTGFLLDVAPQFHALLVFIEHRFYGKSLPFGKDSYKSANTLGYLTSEQALADYAVLITSLKHNLSSEASPVVVFGGSYGGMLAAWFRLKYPHVAIGALASSAPILQFDNITPDSSFYDAVSQDYKDVSKNCFKVIKGSWEELDTLSTNKEGLSKISNMFHACNDIESADSARNWLWAAFVYTAMVNYPTEANFMKPLPAYPVQEMCKIIDGYPSGASMLAKAIAAASLYYNYTKSNKCFNIEHEKDDHGLHGWDWQACTEMVMPMTCSEESMFTPYEYDYKEFAKQCKQKYGVMPRRHWITTEYGGKKIELVLKRTSSNIIFSNGLNDPWSRGGVLKNISDSIVALVTKKGAHHLDLRFATKGNPEWLVEQRKQEIKIIQSWIEQYNADLKNSK